LNIYAWPVAHQALHEHRLRGRIDFLVERLEIDVVADQYLRGLNHGGGRMLQGMRAGLTWLLLSAAAAANAADAPLLARIFADHAVLQRDRLVDVYGRAQPGEIVSVTLAGTTKQATAAADGRWQVALPALPAGGPYTLTARTADREQRVSDVLVGDVWLCSGQSNMEWTVRHTLNADNEALHSANDRMRQVTIPRFAAPAPRADFDAALEWKIAGPAATPDFSAVCYYTARELQKTVPVPMGLVVSSWGGTRIETWLSREKLVELGGNDAKLALLAEYARDRPTAMHHWGEQFQKWWLSQPQAQGTRPWAPDGAGMEWQPAPSVEKTWEEWDVPALAEYDGMMWYRTRVTLTPAQASQAATLALGTVNDVDVAWVNGRATGSGFGDGEHAYPLPAKLLKAGENVIVLNVFDMWGSGGLEGPARGRQLRFADGSSVPLEGWQYALPPAGLTTPRAPWEAIAGVNILYNGMIAPLGRFGLRGVQWYQGEANAGLDDARRYQAQLQGLFADWRRQFGAPLPFLVVQLANYGALARAPVDSGWAQLRDAQRRAVADDGNAGLAVTIDIGNRDDIHPTNKQDVGKRLARAARRVIYGDSASGWGAQPKSARRVDGGVLVSFTGFGGDLLVIGAKDPAGFELCGAAPGSCHFVGAQLRGGGDVLLVDAAAPAATRVRFCWADSPLCNLYDGDGLPAGPFEIAIE
jgi:sialate O-acetylesterase